MADDIYLKHFQKDEIVISTEDARKILIFFFGNNVPPVEQLTDQDIAFAQALLLEAVDKSYAMGYVNAIFDVFYMKVPTDIQGMMKDFVKKAAKNWFDHATGKDLSRPKIHQSVRTMIISRYGGTHGVWAMRMQGMELTY